MTPELALQPIEQRIAAGFGEAIAPSLPMTLDEWSDRYRILTSDSSAEPGRWRTARVPYMRQIMRWLSPGSGITDFHMMKGGQIAFTEVLVNLLGYTIHQAPGPLLFLEPTLSLMKKIVKQRVDPMIEGTPEIADLVPSKTAKAGGNSLSEKKFPAGVAYFATANSASEVCANPMRIFIADEIDRMPLDLDGEGDVLKLGDARTRTYPNALRIKGGTPTIHKLSRTEANYERTEQSRYFIPCQSCGTFQTIDWDRMRWRDLDSPVVLECIDCNGEILESQKPTFLAAGEWRATKPENFVAHVRGVHLSAFYSPLGWYSWQQARAEYVESDGEGEVQRQARKVWVNTVQGTTTKADAEAPDWEKLFARRSNYPIGTVPRRGLLLTAAVDVQRDRLEVEIVSWGRNLWSGSVEYLVFPGDTLDIDSPRSPWRHVEGILKQTWPHELGGEAKVRKMAVDSSDSTQTVYRWWRKVNDPRVALIKGSDRLGMVVGHPSKPDVKENGKRIKRGVLLWPVGVSVIKETLFASLKRQLEDPDNPPTRWVEFPQYSEEYFRQLCAEELQTTKNRKGFPVQAWVKVRERNEALDTQVYNRAAAAMVGLDRMKEQHFDALEKALTIDPNADPKEQAPQPAPRRRPPQRPSIWKSRHDN